MKNFHKDGTECNIIIASCSTLEANFVHDGYHYFPLNIRPSSNAQCSCQFHQNLIRGFWTIIKMMIEYFILILLYMCFIVHQNRPKWRIRGMSGYQRSEIVAFTDLSGNSSRVLTQRLGQQYTQKFIEPLPKANTLWVQSLNVWRASELFESVSCKARAGLLSAGRELGMMIFRQAFSDYPSPPARVTTENKVSRTSQNLVWGCSNPRLHLDILPSEMFMTLNIKSAVIVWCLLNRLQCQSLKSAVVQVIMLSSVVSFFIG